MKKLYIQALSQKLALIITLTALTINTYAQSYIQSECDYAPLPTAGTIICLGDDEVSSVISLGFTFNFYDIDFTECFVSSNGYLSFTAGLGSACCTGVILPSGAYPYSIFFGQEDLDPDFCIDGEINYYTTGAPGSQIFVLSFTDVPHFPGPGGTYPVTVQVQLYETTGEIKIVTTEYNEDIDVLGSTMGLNENGGNADIVAGRNSASWSAFDECISFIPNLLPDAGCMDFAAVNYDPEAVIDDSSCIYGYYALSVCDFAPLATEGTVMCLGDDEFSSVIPLGFTFNFYGTDYSDAYGSSNGYLSFDNLALSGCCTGQILPNAIYTNSIFFGQEDLDPNFCIDGEIAYYTTGTPGNRIFVLSFTDVPHYPGPIGNYPVTVQLQLFETTGEIKIVTTEYNEDIDFLGSTMGLNLDGTTYHVAPGRNSNSWSVYEECLSWLPYIAPLTCVIPSGLYVDGITENDAVLHWSEVDGADQYRVTLQNVETGLTKTKGYYTHSVEILDKLAPLTDYAFRVKTVCYDDLGEISDPSDWVYFTTMGKVGGGFEGVTLFPNPNNGTFTLQLTGLESADFNLNVYDAIGNIVYSQKINADSGTYSQTIDLDVAAGIYFISIKNEIAEMNYPIIIQK